MPIRHTSVHVVLLLGLLAAGMPLPTANAADAPYEVTSIPGTRVPLSATATTLTLSDETVTVAFDLGFTTKFFGRSTDLFWVGSNGFVTLHFQTPNGCCEGATIPTPGGPDGIIAGWWTDLDPSAGGTVSFDHQTLDGAPALVVDFDHVPVRDTLQTATFQVIVHRNGAFDILIEDATAAAGRFATVGAENIDGTVGVEQLRTSGATVTATGFRFTPIIVPEAPPVLQSISPATAGPGRQVVATGESFSFDATVLVGDATASTFVFNSTFLIFFVPRVPDGVYDVTVQHPDGNSSTLPDALTVEEVLVIDFLSPQPGLQGDELFVIGGGFDDATSVFIDARLVPSETFGTGFILTSVPEDAAPGEHLVTVSNALGTASASLTVLGRADVVVASITAARHHAPVPFGPAPDYPEPWTVRVVLKNAGDADAMDVDLTLVAGPDSSPLLATPPERIDASLPTLRRGESRELVFEVGDGTEWGTWRFTAFALVGGAGDRNMTNNVKTQTTAIGADLGFGGAVQACVRFPSLCMPPEQRDHRLDERHQSDVHTGAALRVDATMNSPDFDFNNFPIVFTTFESTPTGFTECTTWRFLGGADGTFRVTMRPGNGVSGLASVPTADNRSSDGTTQTTTWSDVRAFGVILTETEPETTGVEASQPLDAYAFSDTASWSLVATGLTGDFTHCAVRGDTSREEFTFAALPADPNVFVTSFEGEGTAQDVRIRFDASTDQQESHPLL